MPTKSYNDLTTVDHTQAVWVNTLAADSFTVAGLVPAGVTLTLQLGWNFVGFPSFRDVVYTLADLKSVPQVTMVDGFNAAGPYYRGGPDARHGTARDGTRILAVRRRSGTCDVGDPVRNL